jgi:hypothetical protein
MNTRLKIICILFGVAYLYIIGEYVMTAGWPSFKSGFSDGINSTDNPGERSREVCFFNVVPKNGLYSYPSSLINLKTGKTVRMDAESFRASVEVLHAFPAGLNVAQGIKVFFALIGLFLLIYIPVLAYKTIRSIVKNEIFNIRTINRIRRIGYALLIFFGISIYASFISFCVSRHLIDFEDYEIIFSLKNDYVFLLFGLITLLFAEVLKISHRMKEEQDLTI